ncbi:uncharacterized protein LOC123223865 [Mangifera indica]|uniref:uncharacterized protein LOC123223865 n=1 Tax=Mangifera indica TaxID=29780 RepID=UPI001CFB193A|nr:uncharacterized protein LOC123223865 [Mangifera indica]XP_044503234.1 uncharacterized protein LOC123223865 [Mangifera indica]XP_044503235.1 uncharacterized protein LOC123223865 [Mangifera indica]XP_044503236.1 uncharacterized protein LOC123223865 [Mangifera indica]
MPPTYFPLRWESTGDQWWYASPIDWAAANGHYDLVRELLRIDGNHLIKLTSLRRIRRLETVWDDEAQFDDVAKCRSKVARKLFLECKSKSGKNSLITAGYGGWLIYTAASAGDLGFVQQLLERNPLLVFGEGEYGVTDILYAAARSKNCDVFRLVYDFAVSPRFLTAKKGELEENIGDIPSVYRWEMKNRAVHAAARGGNLKILKELLEDCTDVLAFRDKQGSTILHAAAGRGQVEIVKDLIASYDIINSTDHQGNTALHVAAYRGRLDAVEALIFASPSLVSLRNSAGETFHHSAVSGFQTPAFHRLDRQVKLMKQLVCGTISNIEDIINAKSNDGRTALHMAIIGNVHSELVQLLMSAPSIDINMRDNDGMTPLDLLKQRPHSASSDMLIRHLVSAGGIFGSQDYTARRAIATHIRKLGSGSSPGTSFRISDTEIFLYTGIDIDGNVADPGSGRMNPSSTELNQFDLSNENQSSSVDKKPSSVNVAAKRLIGVFHWPKLKERKKSIDEGSGETYKKCNKSDETPTPLRQRFSNPVSASNNKRTLAVRSNQSSPTAKKKFASGILHGVIQAMPQATVKGRSRSSSFSKSSISSPNSVDKQKGVFIDNEVARPSCSRQLFNDETSNTIRKQDSKRMKNQYFCFGGSGLNVKTPVSRPRQNQNISPSMVSVA